MLSYFNFIVSIYDGFKSSTCMRSRELEAFSEVLDQETWICNTNEENSSVQRERETGAKTAFFFILFFSYYQ
jgi:hypothetical protein